jgi:hypothetical protein
LGSGYGKHWGFNVPQLYQSPSAPQQRPYAILVSREQLAEMMAGAGGSANDGEIVLAQPNFVKKINPQFHHDPYAAAHYPQQFYQPPAMKYGQYQYHPADIQQRRPPFHFRPYHPDFVNPYFY